MNAQPSIWLVDDDASMRWVIERAMARAGLAIQVFSDAEECLQRLQDGGRLDLLITDIRMPGMDGHALMKTIAENNRNLPVIVISAHSDLDSVLRAYESGAMEILPKPFDLDELLALVIRLLGETPEEKPPVKKNPASLIGKAPAMQQVFRIIGRLSRASMPVLITGESGTGKELIARTLHDSSPRARKPFVAINTAAIPGELLESELFGHERGAFTGAHARRAGRFEQAEGGTLFLDEIGDMPLDMQTRLLRVLSENEFYRVGGHETVRVNVRIIAATHQDLDALVAQGRFREDLYHRLNVVRLEVPALRERREDIAQLAERFLLDAADEMGVERKQLSQDAMRDLEKREWPGNVRELRNFCRRLTALYPQSLIGAKDLEPGRRKKASSGTDLETAIAYRFMRTPETTAADVVAEVERVLILEALKETVGHKQKAAQRLGWGRNTLTRKMQEYGLDS